MLCAVSDMTVIYVYWFPTFGLTHFTHTSHKCVAAQRLGSTGM